ncbi:MAG: pitrilysin family protein, partial [Bryobacteraceae bacterium]
MRTQMRLGLLLTVAAALGAQTAPYKALKYPALRQPEIPKIEPFKLPNGMTVYLLENHALPLVSGFALVRTGNLFDPPDKIGLASMTGSVMRTGGTKGKSGEQINEELENIAATVESSIGEGSGSVSFNALKENTDQVLAVFKDVMTQPEFRQDKVDLLKTQTRGGISRRNDDAGEIESDKFNELIYGRDNPYGWRMEYEHVDRIQREDLLQFHKRYFFPANIMLAVQGDFNAAELKAKIEKLFADWTVKQPAVPAFPAVTAKPAPGVFVGPKPDVTQTFFRLGHLGGLLSDKDYPALEVMGDILAGSFSSRLFKKVRTELGYAYSVNGGWGANYDHAGIFEISGSTKSASTVDTIQAIRAEIDRIRTGEVTAEELQGAKDTVLNSFVFRFDRPTKTLQRLVSYDYYGYPKDFIFQYQKAIQNVTRADVLRVAKEHLRPEELTIVAVGNTADFGKPLSATGLPVKELDLSIPEPKKAEVKADAGSMKKAQDALARLQKAVGGADKVAAVKDAQVTAESELTGPQGALKVSQHLWWLRPGQLRQEQVLPFGKVVVYSDGKTGWMQTPQGAGPMPPPVVAQVRSELLRFPFQLWISNQDPERSVSVDEKGALVVSSKSGDSTTLTLGEDGLPATAVYRLGPQELREV